MEREVISVPDAVPAVDLHPHCGICVLSLPPFAADLAD